MKTSILFLTFFFTFMLHSQEATNGEKLSTYEVKPLVESPEDSLTRVILKPGQKVSTAEFELLKLNHISNSPEFIKKEEE